MQADTNAQPRWTDYYQAVAHRPPRELYRLAVARFPTETPETRLAIDLGCGAGIEAADLLSRGWHVLAIDQEPAAVEQLIGRVPLEQRERLQTQVAGFEYAALPRADFIWAGLSLPFCSPDVFPALWAKLVGALRPGGLFAGDFFGDRCARDSGWLSDGGMTFVAREQLNELLNDLKLEYLIEEEGLRPMALSGLQQFHAFSVIARRT